MTSFRKRVHEFFNPPGTTVFLLDEEEREIALEILAEADAEHERAMAEWRAEKAARASGASPQA